MREEWTSASGIGDLRGYAYSGAAEHRGGSGGGGPPVDTYLASAVPDSAMRCDADKNEKRNGLHFHALDAHCTQDVSKAGVSHYGNF